MTISKQIELSQAEHNEAPLVLMLVNPHLVPEIRERYDEGATTRWR